MILLIHIIVTLLVVYAYRLGRLSGAHAFVIAGYYAYRVYPAIYEWTLGGAVLGSNIGSLIVDEAVFITVYLGLLYSLGSKNRTGRTLYRMPASNRLRVFAYLLVLAGILSYMVHAYLAYGGLGELYSLTSRGSVFLQKRGLGVLEIPVYGAAFGICMLSIDAAYSRKTKGSRKPVLIIILVVFMAHYVMIGERNEILLFILPVFVMFYEKGTTNLKVGLAITAVIVLYIFSALGYARYYLYSGWGLIDALGMVDLEQALRVNELFAPIRIERDMVQWGLDYPHNPLVVSVQNIVPSFVQPERTPYISEWFAQTMYPKQAYYGAGFGSSAILEAHEWSGVIGSAVFSILVFLWARLITLRRGVSLPESALYLVSLYFMVFFLREGFGGIAKPYIFGIIFPFLVAKLIR